MTREVLCTDCGNPWTGPKALCPVCKSLGIERGGNPVRRSRPLPVREFVSVSFLILLSCLVGVHYQPMSIFSSSQRSPGLLAPHVPIQTDYFGRPWAKGDYLFTGLANYDITARVLLKQNYWLSGGADLAPIDLTLGWGQMSDQKNLDLVNISSCQRCYRWSHNRTDLSDDDLSDSIANTHIIPKDDRIKQKLDQVYPGNVVRLIGKLVKISGADEFHWESSTERDDSGDGACEVMWVDSVEIVSH